MQEEKGCITICQYNTSFVFSTRERKPLNSAEKNESSEKEKEVVELLIDFDEL